MKGIWENMVMVIMQAGGLLLTRRRQRAYAEQKGDALNSGVLRYDEQFAYDKNGNINTLKRYGMKDDNTFGLIDDLNVTESSGNFIRKITDNAGNQSSSDVMEFKYNSEPVDDGHYFYNGIGALMADYHKRICMMKYNYLIMPQSVQFRNGDRIEYVYDAAGVKRQITRKVANRDMNYSYWSLEEPAATDFISNQTVATDYIGNKVYVNNQLKYVLTEEGYMEKAQGSNTFTANYYVNDHLGNHRVVLNSYGNVKQANNFYPSGTSMAERGTDQGVQPYKFGGKELDRTNNLDLYDFEARSFDPVLMRFTRPDPMAGKYPWISMYAYCMNNPVRYIDPTGKWIVGTDGKRVTYDQGKGWSANASADVQKIGNAMMITPDGKKVFNDMSSAKYGITLNYNEGFNPESHDKLGETKINHTGDKINSVEINLYEGKIQEDVAGYQKASQPGNSIQNPTEKDQLLLEQTPTMTERIGQVGAHEGTHATNPNAMPYKVGVANAEQTATTVEIKTIEQTTEFNRPIPIVIQPLIIK